MVFVVARKDSDFVALFVFGEANVTPVQMIIEFNFASELRCNVVSRGLLCNILAALSLGNLRVAFERE